jgi:hypothetical protein
MNLSARPVVAGAVIACVLQVVATVAMSQDDTMIDLSIPLEIWPDGQVKTKVMASSANISERGEISAKGVKIEMYTEVGVLESVILVDSCYVDRENEIMKSDAKIDFERADLKISGIGFEWRGKDQSFKILKKAKVVFRSKSIKGLKDLKSLR